MAGLDLVEDVKERLSIEDVVGEYVELKRAGRNFKGLSPFNPEKSPSLIVSPEKQIWHDFSSGRGGSMFGFVMEMEGLGFRETLELLARKAGLDISQYGRRGGGNDKLKQRVYSALEQATKFYQAQLVGSKIAIEYVTKKRGFNKEAITDFRIGYAPSTYSALKDYLLKKGFTVQELIAAGLTNKTGRVDMFRGRMTVPLMDTQGQVIGFTARSIDPDDTGPKYINTKQTIVYDKSRHVYGFSQAKDAIRRAGYAVVTEGNLDVVSSYQAGVKNVVATAGTAMTIQHLKIIGRMTSDIRLSFDADRAGIAATERAIALAQETDVQLSVITVPDGKDPDDLVREDLNAWQTAISSQEYAVDWLYARYSGLLDISSAVGKREFTDVILKVIKSLKDEVEKDHYLRKLAKDTDISLEAVKAKMRGVQKAKKTLKRNKFDSKNPQTDKPSDLMAIEDKLLGLLLMAPTTRRVMQTNLGQLVFSDEPRQKLYDYLISNPHATVDDGQPPAELQNLSDYVKLIGFTAEQKYQDFDSNERLREAHDLANSLTKTSKKIQKDKLIQALRTAEAGGDEERMAVIIKQIDELNKSNK